MKLTCPRCSSKTNELMECESCEAIGCVRCMKKSHGKWVCHKCETPKIEEGDISSVFSSMFG